MTATTSGQAEGPPRHARRSLACQNPPRAAIEINPDSETQPGGEQHQPNRPPGATLLSRISRKSSTAACRCLTASR